MCLLEFFIRRHTLQFYHQSISITSHFKITILLLSEEKKEGEEEEEGAAAIATVQLSESSVCRYSPGPFRGDGSMKSLPLTEAASWQGGHLFRSDLYSNPKRQALL